MKDSKTHGRLRNIYDFNLKQFEQSKYARREIFAHMSTRKADGDFATKQRNRAIMQKLQRSQKQVEDFIRQRDHQMMLKQELRKLREDDMLKTKQRTKRLENKRKYDILYKEEQDFKLMDTMKERERLLIETRYNNTV